MTEPATTVPTRSRRSLLRLTGAAAVGGAAAVAAAGRAAADVGYTTTAATAVGDVVRQQLNGSRPIEIGFLFATTSSPMLTTNATAYPAALGGWAIDGATPAGAYLASTTSGGFGSVSEASGGTGAKAIGTTAGLHAVGVTNGVIAECSGGWNTGVSSTANGPYSTGIFCSGDTGLHLKSWRHAITFEPVLATSPPETVHGQEANSLAADQENNLWYCTATGAPGTWQKLAGPGAAGAFHPITPTRVYDSRSAAPTPGKLAGGNNRTVSIKDGRDLSTGAVNAADIVPAGATAVSVNVGITQTVSSGWLTVNPGGTTTIGASSINWSAAGQILANGIIAKINATTRELTVVAGGAGQTHFFLDVTGYWR